MCCLSVLLGSSPSVSSLDRVGRTLSCLKWFLLRTKVELEVRTFKKSISY